MNNHTYNSGGNKIDGGSYNSNLNGGNIFSKANKKFILILVSILTISILALAGVISGDNILELFKGFTAVQ